MIIVDYLLCNRLLPMVGSHLTAVRAALASRASEIL
jgi:hypothetical protein